jgi:Zn-dependent protease
VIMLTSPAGKPFTVRLGKIPISVGRSWPYLLIGLLVIVLADGELSPGTIAEGAKTALLWWGCLVAAVAIHEAGHVLMSLALRVPVHAIVLDVWAGHVRTRIPYGPGRAMLVAIAGPLANLATALLSYNNREVAAWSLTVVPFMVLNLGLFIYHVLPGLPQDGGLVVSAVVRWVTQSETSGMEVGAWSGRFVIIAAAALFLGGPIVATGQLPRPVDMVWVGLLVAVLWRETSQVLRMVRRRHLTDQILTRRIARPTETVPRHTRLDIIGAPASSYSTTTRSRSACSSSVRAVLGAATSSRKATSCSSHPALTGCRMRRSTTTQRPGRRDGRHLVPRDRDTYRGR